MSEKLPAPLLVMLDELERPDLERIALVLRAKLRAAPNRRHEREHELGPLHEMLKRAGLLEDPRPRFPRQAYDRDRPKGAPRGASLVDRYGSWFKACQAATSLNLAGGTKGAARPWSSKHRGRYRGATFTREEVLHAVLQCAAAVDRCFGRGSQSRTRARGDLPLCDRLGLLSRARLRQGDRELDRRRSAISQVGEA